MKTINKPENKGVQVLTSDLKKHPWCPHGPTLLFSRLADKNSRNFFACSACRDRKLCSFFVWADEAEKISKAKLEAWKVERDKFLKGINHRKLFLLLNKIRALPVEKRTYCIQCKTFALEGSKQHSAHSFVTNRVTNLTDYQLDHPSEILPPLDNAKKEAQYLFSKQSVKDLVDIFTNLKYKNVICVGTPRLHEFIQANCPSIRSILLDIDDRFHAFFGPLQFCWYNSFNNHFFFKEAEDVFRDFLQSTGGKDTVLVTDPPFGGRIEPLAHTFGQISEEFRGIGGANELPVFWIFPYFMEPQIVNFMPSFQMLDYKVEYENHPLFQGGPKGRKQGSPIRIFTNVNPRLIKLPKDSYRLCKKCHKWVSKENKHCDKCNACTSKNGNTYIHCDRCQRCVKPNWLHCDSCNRCAQSQHRCEPIVFSGACLNCNMVGHKKSDCPTSLKRKKTGQLNKTKKIKK